jgi:transcriptional regulator with XRE-family HTH domain
MASLVGVLQHSCEQCGLPLWKIAHALKMDPTLLSKIQRGQRVPTPAQTAALAKYYKLDETELESMRIAEKIAADHGHNPAATALALSRIQENPESYFVNNKRTAANYRAKSVNKSKKRA